MRRLIPVAGRNRSWLHSPARSISVFVDSKVIDSYGADEEDEEQICNALSLGIAPTGLVKRERAIVRKEAEPDAVSGILVGKEIVKDGSRLKELVGHKSFRPSRLDNHLVNELGRLLKQGNVAAWEAEDVVRNNGGVLVPYHVCEVLKSCSDNVDLAYAFFKWADLYDGFKHDNYSCNAMLKILGQHKRYEDIKLMMLGMEDQMIPRTYITYKTLLQIYVKAGMVEEALEAFHELEQCEVRATVEDYKYFMHSLVMLAHPQLVPLVFNSMQKRKHKPDSQAFNIVINSYAKLGKMEQAYKLFKAMSRKLPPDEYTFAALINGFCKCADTRITFNLLEDMLSRGLKPNEAIYNMMMDTHYRLGKHDEVCAIFKSMLKQGLEPDVKSYRVLLDSFADAGKLEEARDFFQEMTARGCTPSLPAYNTLMSKLGKSNKEQVALQVFGDIQATRILIPSTVSYNIALDLLGKLGRLEDAWNCFLKMKSLSLPDIFSYNILISRLGKAGRLELCTKLLDEMTIQGLSPDAYTFSSVVEGLARSGKPDLAARYLDEMKFAGFTPYAATLDIVVNSLLKAGRFEQAQPLVQELESAKYAPKKTIKTPKLSSHAPRSPPL